MDPVRIVGLAHEARERWAARIVLATDKGASVCRTRGRGKKNNFNK
jgi:hypothetical protein